MDVAEVLDRLRAGAVPIAEVRAPHEPGVYAWFLDDPRALPTIPDQGRDPIYVGMSKDLADRGDDNHFSDGGTGFSTLRRSLGALLKSELDLRALPRGTGSSEQNFRCYTFDPAGEKRLSAWMREHLRVAVLPHAGPDALESELIPPAQPPLNLNKWPNPHRADVMALRKVCADDARRAYQTGRD